MLLAKEKAEPDEANEACWSARRKQVAGLSRVVSKASMRKSGLFKDSKEVRK